VLPKHLDERSRACTRRRSASSSASSTRSSRYIACGRGAVQERQYATRFSKTAQEARGGRGSADASEDRIA